MRLSILDLHRQTQNSQIEESDRSQLSKTAMNNQYVLNNTTFPIRNYKPRKIFKYKSLEKDICFE